MGKDGGCEAPLHGNGACTSTLLSRHHALSLSPPSRSKTAPDAATESNPSTHITKNRCKV